LWQSNGASALVDHASTKGELEISAGGRLKSYQDAIQSRGSVLVIQANTRCCGLFTRLSSICVTMLGVISLTKTLVDERM